MGFVDKRLAGAAGPYIAGALGAVFLGLCGGVWVLSAELRSARAELAPWKAAFGQEQGAFRQEQAIARALVKARASDHKDAVTDANGQAKTCQARVDTARKSATAITHLLNEPPHANPDPAEPELLTAGELQSAQGR
jgi:hypothetical protein